MANLHNSTLKKPKNLLKLSKDEKKEFLDSFELILCDCDGVIWQTVQKPITGVNKGIEFLINANKKVVFVTNNSLRSTQDTLKKIEDSGIAVVENDIIHPALSIVEYLKNMQFEGLIYAIANSPFKEVLKAAGYSIIDGPNDLIPETLKGFQSFLVSSNEPVKAVIFDCDFNLSIGKIIRASTYLKTSDCLLIGGAADEIIPFGTNHIVGPGPFIKILENLSNKKAAILGKPGVELAEMLQKRFNFVNPSKVLFIGDSIEADIRFGNINNYQTLCVFTGKTKVGELDDITNNNDLPDFYIESLSDFQNFL